MFDLDVLVHEHAEHTAVAAAQGSCGGKQVKRWRQRRGRDSDGDNEDAEGFGG